MRASLALLLGAALLQVWLAAALERAWRRGRGTPCGRVALTVLFLHGLGFAVLVNEWNLLGFRL